MKRRMVKPNSIAAVLGAAVLATAGRGEVLLQYFETGWDEIYRRLPEIAEAGYEGLWTPPPGKAPAAGGGFAGGGNVGYSLFDRFDLGDVPQRGARATRYGTRGSLRNLVDNAHRCDLKVYPDIVFNHTGNGPDIRTYPGTKVNDFHGTFDPGQPGGFRRAPNMTHYDEISGGYGRTFQEELVNLFDLALEFDQRFSTGDPNYAAWPAPFVRQPGWAERYPFHAATNLPNETVIQFMHRWINWLGYAMDYDGVRLDAPKHVIADFLGAPGSGFNHEIQWNFDSRRGFSDGSEHDQLEQNYVRRDDALIFAEMFIGSTSDVDYWRTFGVRMRYLDFPRKDILKYQAFGGSYNLGALASFAGFAPTQGVLFCQSHDEDPPAKLELAYAYILTHVGLPVVYFTGNNLAGSNVNVRTWLKIGHGGALGDYGNGALPNLVYIHNQFARGREWTRWAEGDVWVHERYDDLNGNESPDAPEGLLLVGLNDSGAWQTRNGVPTAFAPGTVLKDYTGNNPNTVTVDGDGKVSLSIPPGANGQSWVCYAPRNAEANGDPIRFTAGGSPAGTMGWVVPGGALASSKPRQVVRLTGDTADLEVYPANPLDSVVNGVMVKWGGGARVNGAQYHETNNPSLVTHGFQQAVSNAGYWTLTAALTNVPEGLHLVKARCFNARPAGHPALFQTFAEAVYVDRRGPDLDVAEPAAGAAVPGDVVCVISNADKTAALVEVRVDGGAFGAATEVMKGVWKRTVAGLTPGPHSLEVRALEQDWSEPRAAINTSTVTRSFTVAGGWPTVALGFAESQTIAMPFFVTTIASPGLNQGNVKLYWDGFELVGVSGTNAMTHVFDGCYLSGGVTDRLWGCFVNGAHFFEAVAVSAGQTARAARTVVFNLYGNNQIDSDGDGLPDDVEMPNFSQGTNPGPNVPWPGDTSAAGYKDMIPNHGETWTRLNPYNADTDYNGVWDGDEDGDGDGVPNGCEVRQGYLQFADPYHFNIYHAGSTPGTCVETNGGAILPSTASWSPTNATRCPDSTLIITYRPNQGPLSNASPVQVYWGFNGWTGIRTNTMTAAGVGEWQYTLALPTNASVVDFVFRNPAGTVWDNNHGADWHAPIAACVVRTNYFNMDGQFDGAGGTNYVVAESGMKMAAAARGDNLYVATWSANGSETTADHFLYVTDRPSPPQSAPWAKAGQVWFDAATKPYLAAESAVANGFVAFNRAGTGGRSAMGPGGAALEGELNLAQVFGYVPEVVYVAAVAMGDADGGGILSQCPPLWTGGEDLESVEFQPVPLTSIRDEDGDGVFDVGRPQLWTVVGGSTNDGNYGLRRFFLDETMDERDALTVILRIDGPGGTNVVSDVELISNLNRRDFAVLPGDEDPDTVTASSASTYYRAYPMAGSGDGPYVVTLPVTRCGAYRLNARYRLNGRQVYYADHGLRRECAVVVSPKKALNLAMYELNPMIAEARDDTFAGRSTFADMVVANTNRPEAVSTGALARLGVNMIWLQPIHPIGSDGRETDPSTGQLYDPGSPYAVRNYWKVNPVLGNPSTEAQALAEFTNFVQAMDRAGVGVMLDGTFNHSAWDCEIDDMGLQLFPGIAASGADLIRSVRPGWYSRKGNYGLPATYYGSAADNDLAPAPDRTDFGKWNDVADFFFGAYDSLVQGQTADWRDQYLRERDRFDGFADPRTRELWQYFAHYPIYWLEKTGHPAGTPKTESYRGIDGLRCDFAQGLPSAFWEYCINRTRNVKWDFVFMAESLDGYRTVGGSPRHGVGYRSARHFDVLNENLVFYWRDQFFNYFSYAGAKPWTYETWQAFDARRHAYDTAPLLLNLTGHDEILPHDQPWRVVYAYAALSAMDGVPMLVYGQEAGLQNDAAVYTGRGLSASNNFARYEMNFGKSIPHFKRYNHLTNVWNGASAPPKAPLRDAYARIQGARRQSTALRSRQNYFLSRTDTGGYDSNIFAVAKFSAPGVSAATQDVVLCFVNNDVAGSTNRWATFALHAAYGGANWFGIETGHHYNVVDLLSPDPTNYLWETNATGSALIAGGLTVGLTGDPAAGRQAQYLRLVDRTANPGGRLPDQDGDGVEDHADPDDDNDGLPDAWEGAFGPREPQADDDGDGKNNLEEFLSGTRPDDPGSVLRLVRLQPAAGATEVAWTTVSNHNYRLEARHTQAAPESAWQTIQFATARGETEAHAQATASTSLHYRAVHVP